MNRRDKRPPLADWHLWTEVTRTVDPLRPQRVERQQEPPLPLPPAPEKPQPILLPKNWTIGSAAVEKHKAGRHANGKTAPGRLIEPGLLRKLTRGQIAIDGTIDLHGMRQTEAREALQRFVAARAARGDRTILVITGKGLNKIDESTFTERGVLRSMLPRWLTEPSLAPMIAGWEVSAQSHGGDGAFYVRLRRGMK